MKKQRKRSKKETYEDRYKQAMRYLENAEAYLKKTTIDGYGYYKDYKYVRTAGHTALCGVYVALDPFLKEIKDDKRKNVDMYRELFPKRTRGKERKIFNAAYGYLHHNMGYDGEAMERYKQIAFEDAKTIIEWARQNYPQNVQGASRRKKRCRTCKRSFLPERKNIVNCKNCRK